MSDAGSVGAVAKSNSEGRKRIGAVVLGLRIPTVFGVVAHFLEPIIFVKILVLSFSRAQRIR